MARTRLAQAATFNTVAIGGLSTITTDRDYNRIARGVLDGAAGGQHGIARGDMSVRGSIAHEDAEKFLDLVTSTPGTGAWYEKNVGAATYTQRQVLAPVFGTTRFEVRIGGKARVTHNFEATFGASDGFDDVDSVPDDAVVAATVEAARTVPQSVGELLVATFDPGESPHVPITLSHKQGCTIAVGGRFVTDSDEGQKGRTAVEFDPQTITVSITYRDTTLAAGPGADLAQQLLARAPAALELEFRIDRGTLTDTKIRVENVNFTRGPRTSPAGEGYTEYTVEGECDWVDVDGTRRELTGDNKMITVTVAAAP